MHSTQPNNQNSPQPKRPLLSPRDQSVLLVATTGLLIFMCAQWWYRGGPQGQLIEIDRAAPLNADYVVDINAANWPELIQLPGLGETLAKRLIEDRAQNGPYHTVDELVRVNGIGPRTLEKLRPYLLPIPDEADWASLDDESTSSVP